MNIVILFLEPSIERILRMVLAMDGYAALATRDAHEALQAVEAHERRSLSWICCLHE